MDLHQLRVFVAVYRERSFSKAAHRVGLSQPTISEHIKGLEKELGCRLFDRVSRTVIPTVYAHRLFEGAVKLLDEAERLKNRVLEKEPKLAGEIKIGASTIPGSYILPSRAAAFKKQYPEVSFEIYIGDTREITELVVTHRLMMAVVGAELEPQRLKYDKLMDDELVLACRTDLVRDDTITVEALREVPFILREEGSGTRKAFEEALKDIGLGIGDLNVVGVLGGTDAIRQAMKEGLGVSVISRIAIEDELQSGQLKSLTLEGFSIKRAFSVVTHPKRTLPQRYQVFLDFLLRSDT